MTGEPAPAQNQAAGAVNTIGGGIQFGPVLQGRDMQATFQLPAAAPLALGQLPAATRGSPAGRMSWRCWPDCWTRPGSVDRWWCRRCPGWPLDAALGSRSRTLAAPTRLRIPPAAGDLPASHLRRRDRASSYARSARPMSTKNCMIESASLGDG